MKSSVTEISSLVPSTDELQIIYFQLYIAVSMYRNEKSHARAKEAVPSLSNRPTRFCLFCVTPSTNRYS